jgi:hypothetical protein
MAKFLQLALWNANGLTHHADELQTFLAIRNTDIMPLSETHFTQKSYLKLPHYAVYHTNPRCRNCYRWHCHNNKNTIKHHPLRHYTRDYPEATSVSVEDSVGLITISAVYLPPKHTVQQEQLEEFYATLRHRFIADGDYIANHTDWGSRIITRCGREVLKIMESNNLIHLSTGQPIYLPSDMTALKGSSNNCKVQTRPLVRDGAPPHQTHS